MKCMEQVLAKISRHDEGKHRYCELPKGHKQKMHMSCYCGRFFRWAVVDGKMKQRWDFAGEKRKKGANNGN